LSEITNINEASISILSAPPRKGALAGTAIELKVVTWDKFQTLWNETAGFIIGALQAIMALDDPGGDPDATKQLFQQIAPQLGRAPHVISCLIKCSADTVTDELLGTAPYPQVLDAAWKAFQVNFVDTTGLRDFFTAMSGAVSVVQGSDPNYLETLPTTENTSPLQATS
jgi:hypothetical protein